MKLAAVAFRNIRRNRRRSLLSGLAIALSTLFITFMFSVVAGFMRDYRSNVERYLTGHVRLRHRLYDANEQLNPLHLSVPGYEELVARLEAEEGVRAAVPRIQFASAIYREERTFQGIGLGIDFRREGSFMRLQEGIAEGRLPAMGTKELVLSAGLAEELGVVAGEKLTLLGKNKYFGLSGMTFTVSGIVRFPVPAFNRSFFLVPIDTAARFLKMEGEATEVLVQLEDPERARAFTAQAGRLLAELGREGVEARAWSSIGMWYSLMRLMDMSYNFIALFFFILGTTVIANTTMMVIYERMREIGTVSALGMTPAEIVRLFFLEAFFIAVMSAGCGVALGTGISLVLSKTGLDLSGPMEGIGFEVSPVISPQLNVQSTVFVFFYSVAVASLASFLPSRRAARVEPVEALRSI